MGAIKKATVYVEESLHKAARIHAAELEKFLSDVVNEALASYFSDLQDDYDDLKVVKSREKEPRVPMERVLKRLKADGITPFASGRATIGSYTKLNQEPS